MKTSNHKATVPAIYRLAILGSFQALALLVFLTTSAYGQTNSASATAGATPLGMAPGAPAGSYALSNFEHVNPYNGHLDFHLPLARISGRAGAKMTMMLPIEQVWRADHVTSDCGGVPCTYDFPTYNWWTGLKPGYGPGVLQGRAASDGCPPNQLVTNTLTRLTFTAPDGTEFELRDKIYDGKPLQIHCDTGGINQPEASRGTVFVTNDGTAATFVSDTIIYDFPNTTPGSTIITPTGFLMLRDGTRYRIENGLVIWMRDSNGNKLSFTYDSFSRVTTITDSLNRQVTVNYDVQDVAPYGLSDQIIFKGFGGAQRIIRISKGNLGSALRAGYTLQPYTALFPELNSSSSSLHNPTVVTSVWLPDARRYQLFYNSYGELARVVLPTGGAFEYDYSAGVNGMAASGVMFETEIYRRLVERRVYSDGVTLESRTQYSRPESAVGGSITNLGYVTVAHLDGGGLALAWEKHYFSGSPSSSILNGPLLTYPGWKEGKESQTEALDTNGVTVLRRQVNTWAQRTLVSWWQGGEGVAPEKDPRITRIDTTLTDTNQVSALTIGYDQYNNKTDVYEYDFGSGLAGALVRRTHTDYLTVNPVNGSDYTSTTVHLRSLPAQESVYDAGGIEKARTTFEYDNYAADGNHAPLVDRLAMSGLDGGFNTFYLTRGNLTRVSQWVLSTGASLNAYSQYDIAGNVVKTIDPKGNATTIDFSDRFGAPNGEARSNSAPAELAGQGSYAFPTLITNALGQSVYTQFDYSLGRPVDAEDANGTVASGSYNDILDRPTQVVRGANTSLISQITFSYNDASRIVTSTSDLSSYGDNQLKSEVVYDGLGRTTETRKYESSFAYVTATQTYDALGRVAKSYNPTRNFAEDTYGWTATTYDALSRMTRIETFDRFGSSTGAVTTSYQGNQVTVTDQAGKMRRSLTDGLGRLSQVIEDPNVLAYSTTYSYDVLDDLLMVFQGSQTRSFVYDSLKRLTSATNPENGTASYVYDNNGNLTSKTDARGVMTNFSYDGLNRVTTKTYSDSTPAVTYTYDAIGVANSKGRLTSVSSTASSYSYSSYDALGRVLGGTQTTDGQNYPMSYSYNLAGSLTSMTYPSGRVVATNYDVAGRIASVTNNGANVTNGITYTAPGAIASETLGNGLLHQISYNARMQPTNISLGSMLTLAYDYGLTTNNGNLLTETITPGSGQTPFVQSFTYDNLNRLQSATETVSGAQTWKQTNGFDRYGNRWIDSLNTTGNVMGPLSSQTDLSPSNNQIVKAGYSYDLAGNMTAEPGKTYTFDGENKIATAVVGSTTTTYVYDGDGHRVKKTVGATVTRMVYNAAGELIAEYSGAGSLTKEYIYRGSEMIATIEPTNGTEYSTADHLGTPRVWTNSTGQVVTGGRHDYLPFGEELFAGLGSRTTAQGYAPSTQSDGQRKQFTLKERDSETNLDYFGARYNSSSLGRFSSPDPKILSIRHIVNSQKWNKYSYTINNPLRYFDPDGLEEIEVQLRALIQQRSVKDPSGRSFAGDNRSFSTAANASSRTSITVRIETDASKRANPIISVTSSVGQTKELDARGNVINSATASQGLPNVSGTRDANGTVILNFQQNTKNPLEPQSLTPGISANLNVTVPQNGSAISVSGTTSGFPVFELNVTPEGGAATNIPLNDPSSTVSGFVLGPLALLVPNSVLILQPLPPPPPPPPPCATDRSKPCQ